jgi:hypothetical protein
MRVRRNRDDNATDDAVSSSSGWQWAADFALHKLERVTRTDCGYAGLRTLSPQTTGSVDDSAEGIKWMNEMPSFFLSETLKYLYLLFDEDNILHQDDDRDWIFTTEAHPIHYVPKPAKKKRTKKSKRSAPEDDSFAEELEALKSIVKGLRKNGHRTHKRTDPLPSERWTDLITLKSYQEDMEKSVAEQRHSTDSDEFVAPFVSFNVVDSFEESIRKSNVAHLALKNMGVGSGRDLRKACPNLYSSDLLWMRALNGGATDYADGYVSVTHDALQDQPMRFTLLGAADALGSLGTGVYFGQGDDALEQCPLPRTKQPPSEGKEGLPSSGAAQAELVNISSDIGNFEIASFSDGTGFYVHHVDRGEKMIANFVFDEVDTQKLFSMTYAGLRIPAAADDDADESSKAARPLERRVVVSDFEENAFSCEVQLFEKSSEGDDIDDISDEEVLATLPCAPAMFGPTQLSLLMEQDLVSVEAVVLGPTEDNSLGCNGAPQSSDEDLIPTGVEENLDAVMQKEEKISCKRSCVAVVHRGVCTFFSKAVNLKNLWDAKAIIVVNTEEDEIFVMSHGGEDVKGIDPKDVPLSVLVNGSDGENLLKILNNTAEGKFVFARIALQRREAVTFDNAGKIDSTTGATAKDIYWPMVRGTGNLLQVLAYSGWGIQAVQTVSQSNPDRQEWNLHLLRHSANLQT